MRASPQRFYHLGGSISCWICTAEKHINLSSFLSSISIIILIDMYSALLPHLHRNQVHLDKPLETSDSPSSLLFLVFIISRVFSFGCSLPSGALSIGIFIIKALRALPIWNSGSPTPFGFIYHRVPTYPSREALLWGHLSRVLTSLLWSPFKAGILGFFHSSFSFNFSLTLLWGNFLGSFSFYPS